MKKESGFKFELDSGLCKACGICLALCPKQALAADPAGKPVLAAPGRCGGCGLCELRCPDFAIRFGGR